MSSIQICNQSDLRFGEQCGRGIVGAVDNVRYWSVERSASQIVAGMSSQYTAAEAQAAEGLIGSWSFEDGFVSNATGTSGQGKLQSEAMVAEEVLVPDCNSDGIVDFGQILDGTFADVNADGIPDVCQAPCVPSDLNNDRSVDGADLGMLLSAWGPAGPEPTRADINGNGIVDGADLGVLLANWGACGEAPPWATVVQWQPDPAVVTDDQLRSAIAATGLPWRVRDTSTQIEMLLVPPGTFQMGCVMGSSQYGCTQDELPVHQVTLTRAFYLGRYELTQAQWTAQMTSNPSYFQGYPNSSSRPVEQVSWNTIQGYLAVTGFRLPTEAEWEFACRAGTQTPFHNGSADDGAIFEIAWFNLNSGFETKPVGLKSANGFGFHDMLGNVGEWVQDRFAPYTPAPQVDPSQPSGNYVVMRGGGWGQLILRSSYRPYDAPNIVYQGEGGFRVARNP
jgi:formylglycine-generating enzyme required for sulfatase activity